MRAVQYLLRHNFMHTSMRTRFSCPTIPKGKSPISADVGGTAGLFLGASLLTAMEMGEFLLLSVISFFKHLSDAGQIHDKSKMGLGNPEETQEKNGNVIKERDDVLGLYNTIFSTNSPTNVQKIKVQEKS